MRRFCALLATLVVGLALAACGSTTHAKNASATTTTRNSRATTAADVAADRAAASFAATRANLRSRPADELILDGFSQGSLSQLAYRDYQNQGGSESVSIDNDPAPTAFNDLCTGSVDVVDSSSTIPKADLSLCHEDGITPVQLQVGSDAVVLATENETDVGADCLTLPQVKAIFKAGSPIENWDQLGFDDVPLKVAGPNPANGDDSFFGASLVGASVPTLTDFRFDYHVEPGENGVKSFVVGTENAGELASAQLPEAEDEIANLNALIGGDNATIRGAKAAVKAYNQAGNVTQVAAFQVKLARVTAAVKALESELAGEQSVVRQDQGVEQTAEEVLGRLGVFQYAYYTLFEEQLRPLEISSSASPENCVFPSQDTITSGDYPLSRQLLLTVSLQELRSNPGLRAFLLSYLRNATTLTADNVLVPLPNNVLVQEEDWLNGKKTPTTVTGATSASGGENSMSNANDTGAQAYPTSSGSSLSANTGSGATAGGQSSGIPQGVH